MRENKKRRELKPPETLYQKLKNFFARIQKLTNKGLKKGSPVSFLVNFLPFICCFLGFIVFIILISAIIQMNPWTNSGLMQLLLIFSILALFSSCGAYLFFNALKFVINNNSWIILSLTMLFVILFFGYISISTVYKSDFPINIGILDYQNKTYVGNMTCNSITVGNLYKVEDDILSCRGAIQTFVPIGKIVKTVNITEFFLTTDNNITGRQLYGPMHEDDKTINKTYYFDDIRAVLPKKEGKYEFWLEFNNVIENVTIESNPLRFDIMTQKENDDRRSGMLGYYTALISLAVMTSFVGMRNLMEIWKNG